MKKLFAVLDMSLHRSGDILPRHVTKEDFADMHYARFIDQYEMYYNDMLRTEQIAKVKHAKKDLSSYSGIRTMVQAFFPKARVWHISGKWKMKVLIDNPEQMSVLKQVRLFIQMRWMFLKYEWRNLFKLRFQIEFGKYDPTSEWVMP